MRKIIHNLPEYYADFPYIVARSSGKKLYYYGAYKTPERAQAAARLLGATARSFRSDKVKRAAKQKVTRFTVWAGPKIDIFLFWQLQSIEKM